MASFTLFIKNIPTDTNPKELKEFTESAFDWQSGLLRWLRKHQVVGVKVLTLMDGDTKLTECHGLVTVEPNVAAEKIIRRLNLKPFRGHRVAVRRYYKRSLHDRRRNQRETLELQFQDQRKGDRRRKKLEDVTLRLSGVEAFSRRLI